MRDELRGLVEEMEGCGTEEHGWNKVEAVVLDPEEFRSWIATLRAILDGGTGEWRTIESAPKDGSDFLAHGEGEIGVGFWMAGEYTPLRGAPMQYRPRARSSTGEPFTPTHWMPLPAPPALHERDGGGEVGNA